MAETVRTVQDEVLLIEDDEEAATMYVLGLSLHGHGAHIANSGLAGLAEAELLPPDVIILDLNLPDVDGLDLLDDLRSHAATAEVPVIVLSDDDEAFDTAYRRGATECHTKYKTTPEKLVTYVEAAITARR
jgi:DNA-binding response OmpR family regulator